MSNIKKWSYIYKTFNECSRSSILGRFYLLSGFKKNYKYWVILGSYCLVSTAALVFVLYNKSYFFISVLIIVFAALLLGYVTEEILEKDLKKYYETNGLSQFPFYQRVRYLSYVMFKERIEKEQIIKVDDIDSLIVWEEVSNKKIDRIVFFKSKWFFAILSTIFGFTVQYVIGLKLNSEGLLLISLIIFIILWLAFIIFDFSIMSKQKKLNINRFLKWYQLDSKET